MTRQLMKWLSTALFATGVSLIPPLARAERSVSPPIAPDSRSPNETWYGAPIVLADGVAVATLAISVASSNRTGLFIGGATAGLIYLAGGPLVHTSEEQVGHAGLSVGLRLLPLLVGAPIAYFHRDDRDMRGLAAGGFIMAGGAVAAMIIDDGWLAWRPAQDKQRVRNRCSDAKCGRS